MSKQPIPINKQRTDLEPFVWLFNGHSFHRVQLCFFAVAAWLAMIAQGTVVFAQNNPPENADRLNRVYLPLDQLEALLKKDRRGVLMPRDQFQQLYQQAQTNFKKIPQNPADYAVSDVRYQLQLQKKRVLIQADLQFHQFAAGWQAIRLPIGNLSIENATLNGAAPALNRITTMIPQPGQPVQQGQQTQRATPDTALKPLQRNTLVLLNNHTGKNSLKLELSQEIQSVGNDQLVLLSLLPAPSATLEIILPKERHLLIDGFRLKRPAANNQQAAYQIPVGGKEQIRLKITDKESTASTDQLLFANTAMGLMVSPGETTYHSSTNLQIFGQQFDQIKLQVPNSLEITNVNSPGLDSWLLSDAPGNQSQTAITLKYRQPVTGGRQIEITGVQTSGLNVAWSVPGLSVAGATSHTGHILLTHPTGTRLIQQKMERARRTNNSSNDLLINQIGPAYRNTRQKLTYDFWSDDFELQFVTETKQREVLVELLTSLNASSKGLQLGSIAKVECLNAPLFDLQLTLPAEWSVESILLNGKSVEWQKNPQAAGTQFLNIKLDQPLQPGQKIEVTLNALRELEDGPITTAGAQYLIPEVRLPQANIVEGSYVITAEPDFDVTPQEIEGLDPVYLNLPNERAGFRYQETRFSGQLQIALKPTTLSANTLMVTRLDPAAMRTFLQLKLDLSGGGLREFNVTLPESVKPLTRFKLIASQNGARLIEQSVSQDNDKKTRTWTLKFDKRLKHKQALMTSWEQPRKKLDSASLPVVAIPNAERQYGYLAIEASGEQRLTIKATDADEQPLREIDLIDLPLTPYQPKERIVAAYRYLQPDYAVTIEAEQFDPQAVPTAVCTDCAITSLLGESGELQHQAIIQLKAVGTQSLLLRLPADATLWSTELDGQPMEVRRTEDAYLIPFPVNDANASDRQLKFLYETTDNQLDLFGKIVQQPPVLAAVAGDGTARPLKVLLRQWQVYYPEKTMLINSDGAFEPTRQMDRGSLLGRLQQSFRGLSPRVLLTRSTATVVAIAIIFLLTISYRRKGFKGLAGLGAIGVVLIAFTFLSFSRIGCSQHGAMPGASEKMASEIRSESSSFEPEAALGFPPVGNRPQSGSGAGHSSPGSFTQDFATTNTTNAPNAPNEQAELDQDGVRDDSRPSDYPFRKQAPLAKKPAVQPQPETKPSPQSGHRTSSQGGLLSIGMNLTKPESGYRSRSFRYIGTALKPGQLTLDLDYENRQAGLSVRLFVAVTVLLAAWLICRKSIWIGSCLLLLGFTLPLALIPFVPVGWHMFLDGCFIGSVIGMVCGCLTLFAGCCHRCYSWCCNGNTKSAATAALVLSLISISPAAFAQRARSMSVPVQPPHSNQILDGLQSSLLSSDPATTPTVVVPYDDKQDPLKSQRIFLSTKQFLELWNAANPTEKVTRPAPYEGVVAGALYTAVLLPQKQGQPASVRVKGRYVLHSFRDHAVTFTIPLGHVAVESARLDGEDSLLIPVPKPKPAARNTPAANAAPNQEAQRNSFPQPHLAPQGDWQVIISKPGQHVLDVEFIIAAKPAGQDVPLTQAGQFTLPLYPVPQGRMTWPLPQEKLDVTINGTSRAYRFTSNENRKSITLPVNQGGSITVRWQPEQDHTAAEATIHAEATNSLTAQDDGMALRYQYQLKVLQGTLLEAIFNFPTELKLQSITGPDINGWEVLGSGADRKLKLFFRKAIEKQTTITFKMFHAIQLQDKPVDFKAPEFSVTGVARETGSLAILAQASLQVQAKNVARLNQVSLNEFSPGYNTQRKPDQPELLLGYRYHTTPYKLTLSLSRRTAQTRALAYHGVQIERRKVRITSQFRWMLSGVPRTRLSIGLPPGYIPLSVVAPGLNDWYLHENDEGGQDLILEWSQSIKGEMRAYISGSTEKFPDDEIVEMYLPVPRDIEQLQSQLAIWFDDIYTANQEETEGWKILQRNRLSPLLKKLSSKPPMFAMQTNDLAPSPLAFLIKRKTARLSANVLTIVNITEILSSYTLVFDWRIQQTSVDTFVLTTPDWLADKLQFRSKEIREVKQAELADNRIRWTVTLHQPKKDQFFLTAVATLPMPEGNTLRAPALQLENIEYGESGVSYLPLPTWQHYLLLTNYSGAQLTRTDTAAVEEIQADQLPVKTRTSLTHSATELLRLDNAEHAVRWNIKRFARQKGIAATVNYAALTTMIAQDGTWRTQAVYKVKNRARQFIAISLPTGANLLSVFVKGQPARAVKSETLPYYLIALPKTSAADFSFDVKLVLAGQLNSGPLPKGVQLKQQKLDVPAPHVVPLEEDETYGIPVMRISWQVYLPREINATMLDQAGYSNLIMQQTADTTMPTGYYLMDEASSMFKILEGNFSRRQKTKALFNMQKLGLALHNYYDPNRTAPNLPADEQQRYGERYRAIQEKLDKNLEQLQRNEQSNIPFDDNTEIDEKRQREIVEQQVKELISDNTIQAEQNGTRRPGQFGDKAEQDFRSNLDPFGIQPNQQQGQGQQSAPRNQSGRKSEIRQSQTKARIQDLNEQLNQSTIEYKNNQLPHSRENDLRDGEPSAPMPSQKLGKSVRQPQSPAEDPTVMPKPVAPQKEHVGWNRGFENSHADEQYWLEESLDDGLGGLGGPPGAEAGESVATGPVGGLSLAIDIPTAGTGYQFSKVGGQPKLTLLLQPQQLWQSGFSLIWSLIWLGIGIGTVILIATSRNLQAIWKYMPFALAALGLVGFFLLPENFAIWCFVLFLCGALAIGFTYRKAQHTASTRDDMPIRRNSV